MHTAHSCQVGQNKDGGNTEKYQGHTIIHELDLNQNLLIWWKRIMRNQPIEKLGCKVIHYFQLIMESKTKLNSFCCSNLEMIGLQQMWCNLGKSVWSLNMWHFQFSIWLHPLQERYILLINPPQSDQWFQSWRGLKTIENKRDIFLFLAVSHNQCSRLLTDSTRSQHKISLLLDTKI